MSGTFDPWLGRQEEAIDSIPAKSCRQMAATLEATLPCEEGAPLPALWHWMGWTPESPMSGLGPDGHPARGGFLPPVPLERRMWAGGRLEFLAPLRIGEPLKRQSEIIRISEKTGSTGQMVFVTVAHETHGAAGLAIREEQDIVYVAMPETYAPPPPVTAPEGLWAEPVVADTVRLFRFSALTFNAHRIHFDLPYAQRVEKYPGLVVHGPLQAMLLMQAARRHRDGAMPARFSFRGLRPAFHTDALRLQGGPVGADGSQTLCTVNGDGFVCMRAEIGWGE